MSLRQILTEDIRLTILLALAADCGYSHNEHVLSRCLDMVGHNLSKDRIRAELRWLEEQGLILINDASGTLVAILTARGLDVANGRAIVDGVKKPSPE